MLGWLIDGAFIAGAAYSGFYLVYNLDAIINRAGFWTQTDIVAGVITVVTLLEASRRVVGVAITIIAGTFIAYAMIGSRGALPFLNGVLPGILAHKGYKVDRIVAQLYLGQEGIYGIALGVAATFVFIFVLFGAFLEMTAAASFYRHGLRRRRTAAGRPGQGGGAGLGGAGLDFGQRDCQRGDERRVHDSADEKARLHARRSRRRRGGGEHGRANHAADYGRGRVFDCGVHRAALFGHRQAERAARDFVLCDRLLVRSTSSRRNAV